MDQPQDASPERRSVAAGHVLIAGVVGLLGALLLNAPALLETAEGLEHGIERTIATGVMRPVASFSSALSLDEPRLAIDRLLGRDDEPDEVEAPATPPPALAASDVDTTLPQPTPEDPAEAWIIGDSLVELLGPHLSNRLGDSELVEPEVDFRFITGLSRPDYFDWPAYLSERMSTDPPDMIVAMYGGNDGQTVAVDGTVYEVWTPEWFDLYADRVGEAMDALRGDHLRVYWLGLPVMKSPDFTEHARQMNEVYRGEAERRPWVTYIRTWDVFTDENGNYADYLPDADGDLRLMRYEDGVHFTPPGAVRLARHVYDTIAPDWDLPPR